MVYNITKHQLAKLLRINIRKLDFYAGYGVLCFSRESGGRGKTRLYSPVNLHLFPLVKEAQKRGLALWDVKAFFEKYNYDIEQINKVFDEYVHVLDKMFGEKHQHPKRR